MNHRTDGSSIQDGPPLGGKADDKAKSYRSTFDARVTGCCSQTTASYFSRRGLFGCPSGKRFLAPQEPLLSKLGEDNRG